MAAVRYFPQALIDPANGLPIVDLRGALGTVVAKGTTTPLTLKDISGATLAQPITTSVLGFTPTFDVQEGNVEADFLSGPFRTPLFSGQGLRDDALAARAAAELALSAVGAPIVLSGTFAARPAANAVAANTLYYATNVPEQYRSNGTAWTVIGSGGNELAYAEITANTAAAGPAAFNVPGLSITFVAGARPVEVSFEASFDVATVGVYAIAAMSMGGNLIAADRMVTTLAGQSLVLRRSRRLSTLTPGSTYTVLVTAQTYTGTMTPTGATTNPSWIRAKTL